MPKLITQQQEMYLVYNYPRVSRRAISGLAKLLDRVLGGSSRPSDHRLRSYSFRHHAASQALPRTRVL